MSQVAVSDEFKALVRIVGSDFSLTQGVGGNCSVKSGGSMLVKASGRRMDDIDSNDYFYEVSFSNGEFADSRPTQSGKPSIEVFLHALLPKKYVLHLHSARSVALSMVASESAEIASEVHDSGVTLLPYARPGVELKNCISTQSSVSDSGVYLLTNHGTVYQANTVQQLSDLVKSFEIFAASKLEQGLELNLEEQSMNTRLSDKIAANLRWHANHNWRISPDHVVFLGLRPPSKFLETLRGGSTVRDLLNSFSSTQGPVSPTQEQLLWFLNVVTSLPPKIFPSLSEAEGKFLQSWEAEKHRINESSNL